MTRLFEDEYAFVAVGPRGSADWSGDVLDVMARSVDDPRGWLRVDGDAEENAADPERGKPFPFTVTDEGRLREILHQVTADAAAGLLVALTDEWFAAENIPGFAHRKDGLLVDAHTVLARFAAGRTCWTTAGNARDEPDADFLRGVTGGFGVTDYLSDLGLVVVTADEVGVFWRFNTY